MLVGGVVRETFDDEVEDGVPDFDYRRACLTTRP